MFFQKRKNLIFGLIFICVATVEIAIGIFIVFPRNQMIVSTEVSSATQTRTPYPVDTYASAIPYSATPVLNLCEEQRLQSISGYIVDSIGNAVQYASVTLIVSYPRNVLCSEPNFTAHRLSTQTGRFDFGEYRLVDFTIRIEHEECGIHEITYSIEAFVTDSNIILPDCIAPPTDTPPPPQPTACLFIAEQGIVTGRIVNAETMGVLSGIRVEIERVAPETAGLYPCGFIFTDMATITSRAGIFVFDTANYRETTYLRVYDTNCGFHEITITVDEYWQNENSQVNDIEINCN